MVQRPEVLSGQTHEVMTGCGLLKITVNQLNDEPFEIFLTLGKNGVCGRAVTGTIGKQVSRQLRYRVPLEEITKDLEDVECKSANGHNKSCIDAIGQILRKYVKQLQEVA